MVCEGIRVSFYKHEYMVLRLVDQVKGRLRVRSTLLTKSFQTFWVESLFLSFRIRPLL
jgi:hypothetical protein